MTAGVGHIDVAQVRARHPIAEVVAAAGIELRQRGRGWVGCCPFHDDGTPSLSVDAVPDRFHCFGCGASGDVIDFIGRLHRLDFRDAVTALETGTTLTPAIQARVTGSTGAAERHLRLVRDTDPPAQASVTAERAFEINALAWTHLGSPAATAFASSYLRAHRGIDLRALHAEDPGAGMVGYASRSWTSLTDRLRADGVTDDELLALDLACPGRRGQLLDTLRGRIIVPITEPDGRIRGFIGRDITGQPAAPKYRNPTRTPVHDKTQVIYRPSHHDLATGGSVVIVEGVLDALAIAAAAAHAGLTDQVAPVTAGGVTVSPAQAAQVLAVSSNPPRIVLDGDAAGREGTDRWLTALSLERHRPAYVTLLPDGVDPADWLASADQPARLEQLLSLPDIHDPTARLGLLSGSRAADPPAPLTYLPGRALVRLALQAADDPIRDTLDAITPLTRWLGPGLRHALLEQATAEMTRSGWNPKNAFTTALHHALDTQPSGIPPPQRAHPHLGPELSNPLLDKETHP